MCSDRGSRGQSPGVCAHVSSHVCVHAGRAQKSQKRRAASWGQHWKGFTLKNQRFVPLQKRSLHPSPPSASAKVRHCFAAEFHVLVTGGWANPHKTAPHKAGLVLNAAFAARNQHTPSLKVMKAPAETVSYLSPDVRAAGMLHKPSPLCFIPNLRATPSLAINRGDFQDNAHKTKVN